MTETLLRLLTLQACDQRIREMLHTLESLRRSLADLQEQALDIEHGLQVHRNSITETMQARDVLTAQLDEIKDQVREKKRSERRRRVGEVKAYIQREIAILEARQTAVEEELCVVEARISEDTAALHRAEEAAPTQAKERQRATAALLDQVAATKGVFHAAQEERSALTSGITPFVLYEYERVFAHRGGVAVVAIVRETCQGCHLRVPTHICLGLLRHPRLTFCPNCQRILFVSQEDVVTPSSSDLSSSNRHQPRRLQRRTRGAARTGKALLAPMPSQPPLASA